MGILILALVASLALGGMGANVGRMSGRDFTDCFLLGLIAFLFSVAGFSFIILGVTA